MSVPIQYREPGTLGAAVGDDLRQAVYAVIRSIPAGTVMSYGEVAAEAGRPGAARAVGRIMATSDGVLPWWRVVTATGRLAPGKELDQGRRLQAEGVEVADGHVRRMRAR